jgi:hypothetical protein
MAAELLDGAAREGKYQKERGNSSSPSHTAVNEFLKA